MDNEVINMGIKHINPESMTKPRGYSHAIPITGNHKTIYVGGQDAIDGNGVLVGNKERFKSYVAAYLVLIKDGQVLLLRRFNTGYQDGNYSLIAGHLDGGETTKQCIIREASEEAGIMVSPEDLEVVHVAHRLAPTREYFDIYLRAEKWTGDITNMEPDKCDELKWYKMDGLPNNMLPEVKLALENVNKNVHYGEFGWAA